MGKPTIVLAKVSVTLLVLSFPLSRLRGGRTAQFKPASYRRLDQTDHEMEPLATEGASQQTQQPAQQVAQPPPYIGYARPAQAFQQQSSSNVSK